MAKARVTRVTRVVGWVCLLAGHSLAFSVGWFLPNAYLNPNAAKSNTFAACLPDDETRSKLTGNEA
jgi:hypothetical protein